MSILVEIDERIIPEIDVLANNSHKSRAACVNEILRKALRRESIEDKVRRHRESYEKYPQQPDEFYVEDEQLIEAWKDL